jgi:hypothetical protein
LAEEARIWVQRGRLIFHKLATLSAMASEGVVSRWQVIESGDEMRLGPYRLGFQLVEESGARLAGDAQMQPHSHLRDLWPRLSDEPSP